MKHLINSLSDTTLLAQALEQTQSQSQHQEPDRAAELDAVERELRKARTTIDRYLRAFEAGSIPEDVCGERLRELREQVAGLEDQRTRLAEEPTEPERPALAELKALARKLKRALATQDPPRVKELLRDTVDHIAVESRGNIYPVIRVPMVRIQGDQVGLCN